MSDDVKKTIYAIVDGFYSDWELIGFVEDEETAMQLCAQHNNSSASFHDFWHYRPCSPLSTPERRIPLSFVHQVYLSKAQEGLKLDAKNHRVDYFPVGTAPIGSPVIEEYPKYLLCKVPLKELSRERAEKIALDMAYQHLYNTAQGLQE